MRERVQLGNTMPDNIEQPVEGSRLVATGDSTPSDYIAIDRLLVRGILGLHEWERRSRQDILVSVVLYADLTRIGASDDVGDGVDYSDVKRRIMTHVEGAERLTVEALATDIAGLCLGYAPVTRVVVRIQKPSAERFARSVAVQIERTKEMMLSDALIGLGSNQDPEINLPRAVKELRSVGRVEAVSTVFESAPVGQGGANYLNAAARVRTCLPAAEIRRRLEAIERTLGRTEESKTRGSVPIDLDLCLMPGRVIRAKDVSIPDADILSREYLAKACAEVLPNGVYPEDGRSLSSIAGSLDGSMSLRSRKDVKLDSDLHRAEIRGID